MGEGEEEEEGRNLEQWKEDAYEWAVEEAQVRWHNMKVPKLRALAIIKGVLNEKTLPKKDDLVNGLLDYLRKWIAQQMQRGLPAMDDKEGEAENTRSTQPV